MKNKVGQLLLIGIRGTELLKEEEEFIVSNNISGVVLFARNVETPQQVHELCLRIHNLRFKMPNKDPLFIGIDMEGGRVARLKEPFTIWPPLQKLGEINSTSVTFNFSKMMGAELNAVGINLNFAPCVDVLTNPKNVLIGDRSFGTDPDLVTTMSSAMVRGYIKSNVIPCAKHFPGHGNTVIDSHEDLPIEEEVDLETLKNRELKPFAKAFRARLDMVMTAHIKFPKIDPEYPVTLSKKFLQEIMEEEFRYQGIIISDDLDMKALTNNYSVEEIPVMALNAGCNMLLYCNEFDHPAIALDSIFKALAEKKIDPGFIEYSASLVKKLKEKSLADLKILPYGQIENIIGHPDHKALAKDIAEGNIQKT
ncbi:beta-N-acetylhexosaminidase [bacterium]|nr:beta-N-acetylhexosaminidase [bacterium]